MLSEPLLGDLHCTLGRSKEVGCGDSGGWGAGLPWSSIWSTNNRTGFCLFGWVVFVFCILKNLVKCFVLGIKSHKLFPTLFLEECSDSCGNRLEISRDVWSGWSVEQGSGLLGFKDGFWGRRPSRSPVRCSLLWKFTPIPCISLCHGVSINSEHLLLPEAAADVDASTGSLAPAPGF